MTKNRTAVPFPDATRSTKRRLLTLLILLLVLYVFLPQLNGFSQSLNVLSSVDVRLWFLGLCLLIPTYMAATFTYQFLAMHKLQYTQTLLVQVATAFTNRLLPAGIGAMGLSTLYLLKNRHKTPEALGIVAVNNGLGIIGHTLALTVALLGTNISEFQLRIPSWSAGAYGIIAIVTSLTILLLVARKLRHKISSTIHAIVLRLTYYRDHRLRLVASLCSSLVVSLLHVAILTICSWSLGNKVTFTTAFIVFSVGIFIGTATPTPGGLVGMEAGLVAGFIAFGVDPGLALASALLYRLTTYWIPLLPGFLVFQSVRSRYLA